MRQLSLWVINLLMLGIAGWWARRAELWTKCVFSMGRCQPWQGLMWHINDSICVPRCVLEVDHGLVLGKRQPCPSWPCCWCWWVRGQHLGLCFTWQFHSVSACLVLSRTNRCRNQWCVSFSYPEGPLCCDLAPLSAWHLSLALSFDGAWLRNEPSKFWSVDVVVPWWHFCLNKQLVPDLLAWFAALGRDFLSGL